MYRRAPVDLQGRVYAFLERTEMRKALDEYEKRGQPGFGIWFPEPPGVDMYRVEINRQIDEYRGRTELK
jgi:hypothetical protein